ncbi:MAG: hypothetical protein RQ743_11940 [Bacteroidales bacterium]|nr:hypothetical protein [Bacteroidales bacterium]
MNVSIEYTNCLSFTTAKEIAKKAATSLIHYEELTNRTGAGNNFIGWLNLPEESVNQA